MKSPKLGLLDTQQFLDTHGILWFCKYKTHVKCPVDLLPRNEPNGDEVGTKSHRMTLQGANDAGLQLCIYDGLEGPPGMLPLTAVLTGTHHGVVADHLMAIGGGSCNPLGGRYGRYGASG